MSMPAAVRHFNERRLIEALFRRGPLSRADLGRELQLTRSTAGNLVANLAEVGLVSDGIATDTKPSGETRAGRPGSLVELNGAHAVFLGVEIGVGRIRIVGMDLRAKIICRTEARFDPDRCVPEDVADILAVQVKRLRSWTDPARSRSLGIAVAGLIAQDGKVIRAPFLRWRDVPLASLLEARLQGFSPIIAENDANAFALAELYQAATAPPTDACFLLLDVGVGGGIVTNGKLVRGRHGSAGEIGHLPLGVGGRTPGSKLPGSLESYVGTEALLIDHRRRGGKEQNLSDLIMAVEKGDALAMTTLASWAEWLGRGLAILAAILDPERFVLGGPAAALLSYCGNAVEQSVRSHLLPSQMIPTIAVSELGEDGPAIGAALMLHRRFISFDTALNGRDIVPDLA